MPVALLPPARLPWTRSPLAPRPPRRAQVPQSPPRGCLETAGSGRAGSPCCPQALGRLRLPAGAVLCTTPRFLSFPVFFFKRLYLSLRNPERGGGPGSSRLPVGIPTGTQFWGRQPPHRRAPSSARSSTQSSARHVPEPPLHPQLSFSFGPDLHAQGHRGPCRGSAGVRAAEQPHRLEGRTRSPRVTALRVSRSRWPRGDRLQGHAGALGARSGGRLAGGRCAPERSPCGHGVGCSPAWLGSVGRARHTG